ncbi:hypothetical protein B0T16DRAFT_237204 [Cercophora newfieldiana]|uniref:Bromo domain-containing protein n=1 Tax=Cercophora newfieldiana TaxID=92897 RepID=A0AA40CI38_9PEZI|nr:hypothetical protein B0T16DRAFT_237204 [Cercophora newfieldiana]
MTTIPYTTLEILLLFRGIAKYGLDDQAFARISIQILEKLPDGDNGDFDASRFTPEALQELFLEKLWEHLKGESEVAPRHDGGDSSPTSKKRKLQTPPRPALEDAVLHVDKIEGLYTRLYNNYIQDSLEQIAALERQYDEVGQSIAEFEHQEREKVVRNAGSASKSSGAEEHPLENGSATANGVGPSPGVSPIPKHSTPAPLASPRPSPRPLPPQNVARPGTTGTGPPVSTAPLSQPQTAPLSQPGPSIPQPPPVQEASTPPRPPSGVAPVLQLPQGAPPFQPVQPVAPSSGIQHPSTIPQSSQAVAQGTLKWEPPYQPGAPVVRPTQPLNQHQAAQGPIQPPQPLPHQQPAQLHGSQPPSRPLQPQVARPATQPVLVSPQPTGQYPPALQPALNRPPVELSPSPASRQPLLAPNVQPGRPGLPVYQQGYAQPAPGHPGHPVVPSAVPPPPVVPIQQRPHPGPVTQPPPPRAANQPLQAPTTYAQLGPQPASPSPAFPQPDAQRGYNSPYPPPRSAVPDRVQPQRQPGTPAPALPARITPVAFAPQTPAATLTQRLVTGSSTKWESTTTPSTPTQGPMPFSSEVPESPAFERLSPVLPPATLPPAVSPLSAPPLSAPQQEQKKTSPARSLEQPAGTPPKRKVGRPRNTPRAPDVTSPPKPAAGPLTAPPAPNPPATEAPVSNPPVVSPQPATTSTPNVEEPSQPENEPETTKIKDEVTTPRPLTETGDTTADESVAGRKQAPRHAKRKREELSPTPVQTPVGNRQFFESTSAAQPAAAPTEVLWTRQFNKVCGSAMEQIIHHRFANMFAAPIREKDAPGYHKVILQPQDLKSIKAAINAGNRAATQAAAALPGGDPNTSSVRLPISEGLMPPKGIINSGQLEREFAHMFANAIMYNPDHGHGPGPSFLVRDEEAQGDEQEGGGAHGHDPLGYKVDEFGVVNDTRAMHSEVEKLLSELRSAEDRRTGGGRTGATTGTSTRQASVAQRDASQAGDEGGNNVNNGGDDVDEHTATEVDTPVGNVSKRRRTTRG